MLGGWLRPRPQTDDPAASEQWEDEKSAPRPKYRSLVTDPNAPHNAILAELHGPQDTSKDWKKDPATVKPDILHDPATGQPLGILQSSDVDDPADLSSVAEENEELWSHLSAVLDLQAQIARKHLEMEGSGNQDRKKRQSTKPKPSWDDKRRTFLSSNPSTSADMTEILSGPTEGEVPSGKVEGDEEVEARFRNDEFAKLADHFDGTRDAIDDIMGQLDSLSLALTKFHALQVPKHQLPGSRQASGPTTAQIRSLDPSAPTNFKSNSANLPTSKTSTMDSATSSVGSSSHPSDVIRKHPYPLLLNTAEFGYQTHPVESPASTVGDVSHIGKGLPGERKD